MVNNHHCIWRPKCTKEQEKIKILDKNQTNEFHFFCYNTWVIYHIQLSISFIQWGQISFVSWVYFELGAVWQNVLIFAWFQKWFKVYLSNLIAIFFLLNDIYRTFINSAKIIHYVKWGKAMCDTLRHSHVTDCDNWGETVANYEILGTSFVNIICAKLNKENLSQFNEPLNFEVCLAAIRW